jgi:hypothetical protein
MRVEFSLSFNTFLTVAMSNFEPILGRTVNTAIMTYLKTCPTFIDTEIQTEGLKE